MTPRKETEPTKDAVDIVQAVYAIARTTGSDPKSAMDWVMGFLARRDEARDREVRKRTLQAFAEFIRSNAIGLITAESVARVADGQAILASPSPASSEPCEDERKNCGPCLSGRNCERHPEVKP